MLVSSINCLFVQQTLHPWTQTLNSVLAPGLHLAFPLFCTSLIMSLRNIQTHRQNETHKSDRQMENDKYRWGPMTSTLARQRSFGVSVLALGHHLAPRPHHILLLICRPARGSPAQTSRGSAVTVVMPKITSANGREAGGQINSRYQWHC